MEQRAFVTEEACNMSYWKEYVSSIAELLDAPRALATLISLVSVLMILAMIAQTWFIWAGIVGAALTILTLLLMAEYALRIWYWLYLHIDSPAKLVPSPPQDQPAPDKLTTRCADAQGCIASADLHGHNVGDIAETILRHAVIRNTCDRWPWWLRFPAICRAMPNLARIARVFLTVRTR